MPAGSSPRKLITKKYKKDALAAKLSAMNERLNHYKGKSERLDALLYASSDNFYELMSLYREAQKVIRDL